MESNQTLETTGIGTVYQHLESGVTTIAATASATSTRRVSFSIPPEIQPLQQQLQPHQQSQQQQYQEPYSQNFYAEYPPKQSSHSASQSPQQYIASVDPADLDDLVLDDRVISPNPISAISAVNLEDNFSNISSFNVSGSNSNYDGKCNNNSNNNAKCCNNSNCCCSSDSDSPSAVIAALKRDKVKLCAHIESLQLSLDAASAALTSRAESAVQETALWERDYADFEDNKARVKLLEMDLKAAEDDASRQRARVAILVETIEQIQKNKPSPEMIRNADHDNKERSSVDSNSITRSSHDYTQQQYDFANVNTLTSSLSPQLVVKTAESATHENNARDIAEVIQQVNSEKSAQDTALNERISQLEVENTQLKTDWTNIKTEYTQLVSNVSYLETEIAFLKSENIRVQAECSQALRKVEEFENAQLLSDNQSITNEILRTESQALKDRIKVLESAIVESSNASALTQKSLAKTQSLLKSEKKAAESIRESNAVLQTTVAAHFAALTDAQETVRLLRAENAAYFVEFEDAKSNTAMLEARVKEMAAAVDKSVSDHVVMVQRFSEKESGLLKKIELLGQQVGDKQQIIEKLQVQMVEIKVIKEQRREKLVFECDNRIVQAKQAADERTILQSQKDGAEYNALNEICESLRVDYSNVISKLHDVDAQNKILADKNSSLVAQLNSLTSENSQLHNQLNDANTQLSLLAASSKEEVDSQIAKLKAEILELQDDCIDFSEINSNLEEQLETAKRRETELIFSLNESNQLNEFNLGSKENLIHQLCLYLQESLFLLTSQEISLSNEMDESFLQNINSVLDMVRVHSNTIRQILIRNMDGKNAIVSLENIIFCFEYIEKRFKEFQRAIEFHESEPHKVVPNYNTFPDVAAYTASEPHAMSRSNSRTSHANSSPQHYSNSPTTSTTYIKHISTNENDYTTAISNNNLILQLRQENQTLTEKIHQLERDLQTSRHCHTRDAERLELLTHELEQHKLMHNDHNVLLARIQDLEAWNATRLRALEIEIEEHVRVQRQIRADFEVREAQLGEEIRMLEDGLFEAGAMIDGGGRGGDDVFRDVLERLRHRRNVTDDVIAQRNMQIEILEREVFRLAGVEERIQILESRIWNLVQETVNDAMPIQTIDDGLIELGYAFEFFRTFNQRLEMWRSDLVFQKRYFVLRIEDLLESQRLLLAQLHQKHGSGSGSDYGSVIMLEPSLLENSPRRKWKRVFLVVVGALRFGRVCRW
ncbi:hypothetical protein HK100_012539 [Physocladia obscura]|uniref:Pericentrin/AKAP-450 centrosomal targeting domain-containing protein n=1 Tax=Physocladia obscura TaxID=109957 RepID=A0AAD5XG66_9FUNG|nr:hypothetical protein HK100_012539 [Physocladia obscura]